MPGFFVSNLGEIELKNCCNESCIQDELNYNGTYCARNTLSKFVLDKVFAQDDEHIIILEGALLNKAELFEMYGVTSTPSLIKAMLGRDEAVFFGQFRGSFSGAVYDKAQETWVVFTNHYGDNPIFYYHDEAGKFAFGSQVNYLLDALSAAEVDLTVNESAAYMMLSYGFMVDDSTYAHEVKRLLPGTYAVIDKTGGMRTVRYWRPKENVQDLSEWSDEALIKEMDRLFRQAISRELAKDDEYGYGHLCDLSGGLDSRMTTWVAHDAGCPPVLNIAFSQSGYLDQLIAQEIAAFLGNEFIFKSLDDASFVFDAQRIIEMNYGLGLFAGITGGESLLRKLNLNNLGLEHTGQMGDVVVGSFLRSASEIMDFSPGGSYSTKGIERIAPPSPETYKDREQYLLETRGFLGALSSHLIRKNYTEVASPFLDIDFFDFCLSISPEKRINHAIYKQWIIEKYPEAANFLWEKQGAKITDTEASKALRRCARVAKRAFLKLTGRDSAASMNPFDLWYRRNPTIKNWVDSQLGKERPSCPTSLRSAIDSYVSEDASTLEKMQAITVLLSLDYYFGKDGASS